MAHTSSETHIARLRSHPLAADPYVEQLIDELDDPGLFAGGPEVSAQRRQRLLVPFLDFFLRHDRDDDYYHRLFDRKGFLDGTGAIRGDVAMDDLVALRIHSDDLRGERGQRRRLIRELLDGDPNGKVFSSSGTTGNEEGPVTIVRSALQLDVMSVTMGRQMEVGLGFPFRETAFLMYASTEMRASVGMPHVICNCVEQLGGRVHLGARMRTDVGPDEPPWRRLEADLDAIRAFFDDPAPHKIAMLPPPALAQFVSSPELVQAITGGKDVIDLGRGGVLMTGGGLKRTPGYTSMSELLVAAQEVFRAGGEGAPVFDALGLTESASCFPPSVGAPLDPAASIKCPHPLTEVGMLESPQRLELAPAEEFGVERLLFYVNLMCIDYLEAVVPGDIVVRRATPELHQHGFEYARRASENEGFKIREGCG